MPDCMAIPDCCGIVVCCLPPVPPCMAPLCIIVGCAMPDCCTMVITDCTIPDVGMPLCVMDDPLCTIGGNRLAMLVQHLYPAV